MENASKALLIAAAVLIVILLIAFGMRILSPASGTVDSATTTTQQISNSTGKAQSALNGAVSGLDTWSDKK